MIKAILNELNLRAEEITKLSQNVEFIDNIERITEQILNCINKGGKLIFCGNGGSAADCQHIVAEFIVRLSKNRNAFPAIALTSNNSILTAIANDFNYDYIFARQLEGIVNTNDMVFGISTSGNSNNVINAIEYSNANGINNVVVTGGLPSKLAEIGMNAIIIPSNNTQIIQEIYIMLFHIMCERVEATYE